MDPFVGLVRIHGSKGVSKVSKDLVTMDALRARKEQRPARKPGVAETSPLTTSGANSAICATYASARDGTSPSGASPSRDATSIDKGRTPSGFFQLALLTWLPPRRFGRRTA
jgi:hypothetical protein